MMTSGPSLSAGTVHDHAEAGSTVAAQAGPWASTNTWMLSPGFPVPPTVRLPAVTTVPEGGEVIEGEPDGGVGVDVAGGVGMAGSA
jgi:hypothetical protein